MGALCSCLRLESLDGHPNSIASIYAHCLCFRCIPEQLIHAYSALFQRDATQAISISDQETIRSLPLEISDCDTYRSPPRPLPFDDPRFSPPQRDWAALRHGRASQEIEESVPLRSSSGDETESPSSTDKPYKTNYGNTTKFYTSDCELKRRSREFSKDLTYFSPSAEDEDVCPTCLEEYTNENPRIIMKCSHHFHLGCIYEWMERSEACPVCGKKMEFDENV